MLSNLVKTIGKRIPTGYKAQQWPSKFDNIVVAMSSGVDSSVSAALFAEHPNVRGIYMQNWSKTQSLTNPQQEPCYERDWKDVCKVADFLNIPVEKVNFEKDYWLDVFEPMLDQYNSGLTPNPDIGCNRYVKFGKLRQVLDEKYGANNYWLVTGHYSRILDHKSTNEVHLLKSFYKDKDQSYYLSQINKDILRQIILPVGHLTKPEVRSIAEAIKLPTAQKRDSQGICFVNNSQHGKFNKFLEHYLPDSAGDIITIDRSGNQKMVWGKHKGLWSYTVGQKIGLSMPQGDPRYSGAWYVSDKLKNSNEIVIVRGRDNDKLFKDYIKVENFVSLNSETENFHELIEKSIQNGTLKMQYRSLQEPIIVKSCDFEKYDRNAQYFTLSLTLDQKQRAVAPGQYCCLYADERVIGSGSIVVAK